MDATADDWLTGSDDGGENSGISDFGQRLREGASDWGNRMQERAASRRENSKNLARLAEDGAADKGSAAGNKGAGNSAFTSAVNNAKDAENKDGFANNVQGKTLEDVASRSMPGGRMIVNQAKKLGPLGTILIVVMAIVGVFAGSQSLAPFGLIANGLDQFNNLRTSMNRRETYFKRFRLDRTRNKPLTKKATIFSPEKFKVSKKLSDKLKNNKIYYIDSDDFECRFLVYEDEETGKRYAIAANDDDVGKLPSSADVDIDGEGTKIHVEFDERVKIDDALEMSSDFTRSLDKGTRTLKGHIAGWFDDISEMFHFRIGSSRNKQRNTSPVADDDEVESHARNTDNGMDESIRASSSEAQEDDGHYKTNPDGTETDEWESDYKHVSGDDGVDKSSTRGKSAADVEADVDASLKTKAKAIAAGIGDVTNVACTVLKIYSAFNIIMAGIQIANILNYVTGFLEAIHKTQTGDAGKNELAYYMNKLSERGNTYGSSWGGDTHNDYSKPVRENTSSLESPAWNQFFSSGSLVVQANDPVAIKFNREYTTVQSIGNLANVNGNDDVVGSVLSLISSAGSSAAAYKTCLYVDSAAEAVDAVISIFLAVFTVGIGTAIKQALAGIAKSLLIGGIVAVVTSIFMSFLPQIAQWMTMDLIGNMAGEDAAYAINSGFNIYLGGQMQASSGLPATEEKLMAHWREQQEVIAEEGEYERSQRSPFDPTSKYTFVGSIINSLMPIANTMSSPLTTISKTMNTVGDALTSVSPTAKAEGEAVFQTSLNYDCPNLKQLNLVGDAYCNPYFVTDFSTMAADPSTVIDAISYESEKSDNPVDGNFLWDDPKGYIDTDDDGEPDAYNPQINPNGELAKWVVSCAARDSGFGIVDSNVMNAVTKLHADNATLDTIIQTGVNAIPIVSNVNDIAQNFEAASQFGWATGENCVKEEYRYYSRYSEDQRMMESAGIVTESAVASFLDDYYEKNPIDNSYEGQIARYSGMTKDEVEETLATIEALEWIAEYNPTTYGPVEMKEKPDGGYQYESNEIVANAESAIVGNYIIFDDLRTKTKIA